MKHMRLTTVCGSAALALAFVVATPHRANAQAFVSGFVGGDFGGDSGCAQLTDCNEKKLNWGGSIGALGGIVGFEEEFSYAPDFFGDVPTQSTSVFTAMSNVIVGPKIGMIQPYVTGGIGLMKTKIDFTASSLLNTNNNSAAWDLGVGVMGFFTDHVGLRGDYRHYRSFQDFDLLGISVDNTKLRYNRLSGGVVIKF